MPTREAIEEVLRRINDPEIGIDILSLGLVYDITINGRQVDILMTLTTPFCPLDAFFEKNIPEKIKEGVQDVDAVSVKFTFDPPWTKEKIKPEALLALGLTLTPPGSPVR